MKKNSIFVVLSITISSCGTNMNYSNSTISSSFSDFYIENELSIIELNNKINSKSSFALLIFSPECAYCLLAKETIKESFSKSKVELYTLNTYNTKNISKQKFYLDSINTYLNQNIYNENKNLFENEIKLYTPKMIGFNNGQSVFTIIGFNKNDYDLRLNTLFEYIKSH